MIADHSRLFKNWQTDISLAPRDGSYFMGRQRGTSKSGAVCWCHDQNAFINTFKQPVDICQWISFTDFAEIRACVWSDF